MTRYLHSQVRVWQGSQNGNPYPCDTRPVTHMGYLYPCHSLGLMTRSLQNQHSQHLLVTKPRGINSSDPLFSCFLVVSLVVIAFGNRTINICCDLIMSSFVWKPRVVGKHVAHLDSLSCCLYIFSRLFKSGAVWT